MAIIIEGCDLAGKTTLAKALHWKIRSKKNDARGRETLDSCMRLDTGYAVHDRWWLTEYVYGDVLRGDKICSPLDMWQFKLLGDIKGAIMIFLNPSSELIENRYYWEKEERSLESILRIKKEYVNLISKYPVFMPPTFVLKNLDEALYNHQYLQERAKLWKSFKIDSWGTLDRNATLLCGDKFNKNSGSKYPFHFSTNKGCGKYLFRALATTRLLPNAIHIMNLWHKDESQGHLKEAINFLQPRKIIALGKKVSQELQNYGFEHAIIPHPQYWKRFKYHQICAYTKLLRESSYNDS